MSLTTTPTPTPTTTTSTTTAAPASVPRSGAPVPTAGRRAPDSAFSGARAVFAAATRVYRAEMRRLRRPGTAAAIGLLTSLGVLATVLAFVLAEETAPAFQPDQPGLVVSLGMLAGPSGLSLGFLGGTTFIGLLVFILFIVAMTSEYSQGTLRTLFLKEPRRGAWLGGRLAAMLSLVAAALLVTLAVSVLTALLMSEIRDVDTSLWWTGTALREAGSSYLNALLAATAFAIAGTALGILLRSTSIALVVGIAWTFPAEHIIQESWFDATGVLPGLVFDVVGRGGVPIVSYGSALTVGAAYALGFLLLSVISLKRRDVTA